MIIGVQDDHRHYLDQLVRHKSGKLITASSSTRARSTKTVSATTSSAPSHTKILSKRLSGLRRCTKLGSRSSPGSEVGVVSHLDSADSRTVVSIDLRKTHYGRQRRRGWLDMNEKSPVDSGPSTRKSKPLEANGMTCTFIAKGAIR
jgi:hypothetical protein